LARVLSCLTACGNEQPKILDTDDSKSLKFRELAVGIKKLVIKVYFVLSTFDLRPLFI
jgi:hypothetical protein